MTPLRAVLPFCRETGDGKVICPNKKYSNRVLYSTEYSTSTSVDVCSSFSSKFSFLFGPRICGVTRISIPLDRRSHDECFELDVC